MKIWLFQKSGDPSLYYRGKEKDFAIMKSSFLQQGSIIFYHRNYKTLSNDMIYLMILKRFRDIRNMSCEEFEFLFIMTLNKRAPQEMKCIRANNSPFYEQ